MTYEPPPKPLPWRCPSCLKMTVDSTVVDYHTKIKYEGRLRELEVRGLKTAKCRECGELVLDVSTDDQITRAFRQELRLLQPEEIRSQREAFRLTQTELADRLGIAQETVSRWESGLIIQSRAMDNLLRLFFTRNRSHAESVILALPTPLPITTTWTRLSETTSPARRCGT